MTAPRTFEEYDAEIKKVAFELAQLIIARSKAGCPEFNPTAEDYQAVMQNVFLRATPVPMERPN